MDDARLARARRLAHALCHRDRMSPEQAAGALAAYGVHRSAEQMGQDLRAGECEHCAGQPGGQQDQPEDEPARVHNGTGGYLTRQLGGGGG